MTKGRDLVVEKELLIMTILGLLFKRKSPPLSVLISRQEMWDLYKRRQHKFTLKRLEKIYEDVNKIT